MSSVFTRSGDEFVYDSCGVWVRCPLCDLHKLNISSLRTGVCDGCSAEFYVSVSVELSEREW